MSGLMGLELLLLNFALSNLKIETWYLSFIGLIGILIPIISVTAKNKETGSPLLNDFIIKKQVYYETLQTDILKSIT